MSTIAIRDVKRVMYRGKTYEVLSTFGTIAQSQTDAGIVTPTPGVGKRIIVVGGWVMAATAATNFVFNSKGAGAGVAISGTVPCGANGGLAHAQDMPWYECNENETLNCSTGAGGNVNYHLLYIVVQTKY